MSADHADELLAARLSRQWDTLGDGHSLPRNQTTDELTTIGNITRVASGIRPSPDFARRLQEELNMNRSMALNAPVDFGKRRARIRRLPSNGINALVAAAAVLVILVGGYIAANNAGLGVDRPRGGTNVPAAVVTPATEEAVASPPSNQGGTQMRLYRVRMEQGQSWSFENVYSIELIETTGALTAKSSGNFAKGPVSPGQNWGLIDFTTPASISLSNDQGGAVSATFSVIGMVDDGAGDSGTATVERIVVGTYPNPDELQTSAIFTSTYEMADAGQPIAIDSGRDGRLAMIVRSGTAQLTVNAGSARTPEWGDASVVFSEPVEGGLFESPSVVVVDDGAAVSIFPYDGNAMVTVWSYEPNSARAQEKAKQESVDTNDDGGAVGEPVAVATVDPRTCPYPQRDLDQVVALLNGTPVASLPVPALGDGSEASSEQVTVMYATLQDYAACLSVGRVDTDLAMVSDAMLTRIPELSAQFLEAISLAQENPESQRTPDTYVVNKVWDVRVLDDGRLTAQVDFNGELALITIVNVDGRWLIDWFDDSQEIEAPAG